MTMMCPRCDGKGWTIPEEIHCTVCDGRGWLDAEGEVLSVHRVDARVGDPIEVVTGGGELLAVGYLGEDGIVEFPQEEDHP